MGCCASAAEANGQQPPPQRKRSSRTQSHSAIAIECMAQEHENLHDGDNHHQQCVNFLCKENEGAIQENKGKRNYNGKTNLPDVEIRFYCAFIHGNTSTQGINNTCNELEYPENKDDQQHESSSSTWRPNIIHSLTPQRIRHPGHPTCRCSSDSKDHRCDAARRQPHDRSSPRADHSASCRRRSTLKEACFCTAVHLRNCCASAIDS